ncbi:DUF1385 domain-containing protein [Dictyobacter aurantiacus]|uniref:Membrane protein n=1 Tax=Dictyobacter aurantiacus TaxID=1936993 RepID=A0A401ZFX4_9CHLR|nr:DUF1385 domain-containing protein [Dictyobacter aurantiacus]GCE05703.1 membrane protein [Dictyobacter aurantiacus]
MAKFYYGGQAVMEGVMMRGRNTVAVAVRRPEGDIYVHEEALTPKIYQNKYLRLPFLRGMVLLWEMLVLGTRMMTLSANIATGAVDPNATPVAGESSEAGASPAPTMGGPEPVTGGASMILPLIVSLTFAIAIFFVGPLLLTSLLRGQIGDGWLNLTLEGVIRLLLLIGYLYLIGRVPDIQRVFGYHGAEHKAINAMEHGDALTVENVRRASRVHTRCGTGFMLLVMVVSIVVFAFIGSPSLLIKIVSRIVLVPVVAGIAYELMRLGAANYRYRVVRWLLAPGLALQGLTTREPDDSMIECSIASLQRVLARDTEKQIVEKDKPVVPSDLVTNV